MRRTTRAVAVALVALALSTGSRRSATAAPPDKARCFDAYEQGQRARKEARLQASRQELVTCSQPACPAFVRQDCAKWLEEVEAALPTVVLTAHGPKGASLESAHVTMDGKPLAEVADGRPIAVDPGPHDFVFEAGGRNVTTHVVVAEGGKNQPVTAELAAEAPAPAPAPAETRSRALPLATWVLGGVAAAGGVSFAVFGLMGRSVQGCAPTCSRSEVDTLRTDYLVADVSWIAGLAAAGGALYFALAPPRATTKVGISVAPVVAGATVTAGASF